MLITFIDSLNCSNLQWMIHKQSSDLLPSKMDWTEWSCVPVIYSLLAVLPWEREVQGSN